MIVFPNGKINLGLRIINKDPDGYHNLESYMVPIGLCDALEIVPSADEFSFTTSGLPIKGTDGDNLCVKAFNLMQSTYHIPPVRIHLHKIIPMGSGLGGGSSDATFTLALLRKMFDLKFCNNELEELAGLLGSDCPFFVTNRAQLITGRGLATHKFLRMPRYFITMVFPSVEISTSWAYSHIVPSGLPIPGSDKLLGNEANWPRILVNDFEEVVFNEHPTLASIKEQLYESGAFYASMSGSGSAIFGLFKEYVDCKSFFSDMMVWEGTFDHCV